MHNYDIIVVGGGLVGLAFALDMAKRNCRIEIAVIDNQPFVPLIDKQLDNKVYAIAPSNVAYLKQLKAWPEEFDRIGTINKMDVYGDAGGNVLLNKNDGSQPFLAKTIEYAYLQQQLLAEINKAVNISLIYDELNSLDLTNGIIYAANNNYRAALIIGSDGANSQVREAMNADTTVFSYEQVAIVGHFKCEKPHKNIARQYFTNGKIMAYLPVTDKHISIVYSLEDYQHLLDASASELAEEISKAGHYSLGQLQALNKPQAFPIRLYLVNQVYANKVVLIGDAAHTVHPLAGQGVNLGFADAALLADILEKVRPSQYGDTAILAKYALLRVPKVRQMQYVCHWLKLLFTNDKQLLNLGRNFGLNVVNRSRLLKRFFVTRAV
jgi:ubiquinone biosynthesis UbiH/UbiF/VisC/COQ6 family hydroxylase